MVHTGIFLFFLPRFSTLWSLKSGPFIHAVFLREHEAGGRRLTWNAEQNHLTVISFDQMTHSVAITS